MNNTKKVIKGLKRTVDITNKKNIYCYHCEHCDYSFIHNCRLHDKTTDYWKRCKDFRWNKKYTEGL